MIGRILIGVAIAGVGLTTTARSADLTSGSRISLDGAPLIIRNWAHTSRPGPETEYTSASSPSGKRTQTVVAPAGKGTPTTPAPSAIGPTAPSEPKVREEEIAATRSLNTQQNIAAKREIEAYETEKKRIADEQAAKDAAYRKALADREALIAETNRKAAEDRRKWEAAVAACKAGNRSQCGAAPQ